jgi:hypothetical protein
MELLLELRLGDSALAEPPLNAIASCVCDNRVSHNAVVFRIVAEPNVRDSSRDKLVWNKDNKESSSRNLRRSSPAGSRVADNHTRSQDNIRVQRKPVRLP